MYLLQGKLVAKPGHQEELANILIDASRLISTAKGCMLYVVGKSEHDNHSVYVTEIWESKEDHDNSLNVEGVKELIMKAMPILNEKPEKGEEIIILGGVGV